MGPSRVLAAAIATAAAGFAATGADDSVALAQGATARGGAKVVRTSGAPGCTHKVAVQLLRKRRTSDDWASATARTSDEFGGCG